MAINIFQGGSKGKAQVNTASNSQRAQAAKSALSGASETSTSGATAVKTGGTLSKIGGAIGNIANIASKFLPGIGGTIAKGIANVFNDPEWWQSVPGHAMTVNAPLKPVQTGSVEVQSVSNSSLNYTATTSPFRNVFVDIESYDTTAKTVFKPTEQMITQYLMPEIRKVVNAVPLQTSADYKEVLQVNATVYALWRQLLKVDYMLKHGQTYIPNLNVSKFPIFQVANAAWLQSTIARLEEFLRASVRLPHTLCEYLAWRYGRAYRTSSSAKAAVVVYSVTPLTASIDTIEKLIADLFERVSATSALQQANTDLYNAYYDHDMQVVIADETQFHYDAKEFMLRTNLDITGFSDQAYVENLNPVYIDSALDNPTTFMASTVSTIGKDYEGATSVLYPVSKLYVYGKIEKEEYTSNPSQQKYWAWTALKVGNDTTTIPGFATVAPVDNDFWYTVEFNGPKILLPGSVRTVPSIDSNPTDFLFKLATLKSVDTYNKDMLVLTSVLKNTTTGAVDSNARLHAFDVSSLSYDMGTVDDTVLGNEHVFAFANLVDISRKTSMSYAKAEKLVAKETANMIEKLDVASVQPVVSK